MNYRFVLRQFGVLMLLISAVLMVVSAWATWNWYHGDVDEWYAVEAMMLTVLLGGSMGGLLWWFTRGGDNFLGRREALLLVALSWIGGAILAGLPFWLWAVLDPEAQRATGEPHEFASFIDCYFEAMSGLTTTGATILSDIEALPAALLLWRSMTHWLGGLGIVVLFVAVLPMLGVGGKKMFQAEVPGPSKAGLQPRIREAARMVLFIYVVFNLLEIICLRLAGLSWFDAICESFATIATGGFSTRNASVAGYQSLAVEIVIIVFMFLAGVNFSLYYAGLKGGWRKIHQDAELKVYVTVTVIAAIVVAVMIIATPVETAAGEVLEPGFAQAARHGIFQTVSIRTNTGFATADVNPWGPVPHIVLVLFMFTGASAGSTAGGVKLIRCLVVVKLLMVAIERAFRPHVVRPVRVGRQVVDADRCFEAVVYLLLYLGVAISGTVVIYLLESDHTIDLTTAITATAACLSNTGPGLGRVGTVQNYHWFGDTSKCVLAGIMLLGRLEIYAILVLFMPSFWKGD